MRKEFNEVLKRVYDSVFTKLVSDGVKFKKGMPKINLNRMGVGNSKLDKSILIFDLTAGSKGSCCCDCKGCYAKKAQVQYSNTNLFRSINTELARNYIDTLETLIRFQLSKSKKCTTVRIHSSGDFLSQEYVNMWNRIIKDFSNLKFYAYTKRLKDFDFSGICSNDNFNIIDSMIEIEGKKYINYGDKEHVEFLTSNGAFLCPATKDNWKGLCGKDCFYCITKKNVCFNLH